MKKFIKYLDLSFAYLLFVPFILFVIFSVEMIKFFVGKAYNVFEKHKSSNKE